MFQCKEKMRPVKKALKLMDNPDPGLSEKDQMAHTLRCLKKIGNHIAECLKKFKDPDEYDLQRTCVLCPQSYLSPVLSLR